jgi:hypothetical protein
MPTIRVTPDSAGNVDVAGVVIPMALLTAMGVIEPTGKALKLADNRVQVIAKPNGTDTPVVYTVALTVTREATDEQETARIAVKAAEQAARKADKEAKESATRERDLARAEQSGRQGVLAVMGEVGNIAKAANVLAALTGK